MNKKAIAYYVLPVLGLVAVMGLGAGSVYAKGPNGAGGMMLGGLGGFNRNLTADEVVARHAEMFQHQADLLGVSVDEVKTAWAAGKNMKDLMEEKGVSQEQVQAKMKAQHETQMKAHLQTLVEKGVITQAQADQRLKAMENIGPGNGQNGRPGMGMGQGNHGRGKGLGLHKQATNNQ